MKETVSREEVKDILRNRDQKLKSIHDKVLSLYRELSDIQEMRPIDVLPSAGPYGGDGGGHTQYKDPHDVYEAYQKQVHQRRLDIREILWELKGREEAITRVWDCLYALDETYAYLLQALYVDRRLYADVEADYEKKYGISHMTFEKYRKDGLELLIRYYESGRPVRELMHLTKQTAEAHSGKRKGLEKEGSSGYTQLCILDLMKDK